MISTKVPNIGGKIVQDTIQFLGLNLSENRQTGELAESSGISTEFYPTLQQRKGRSVVFRDAGTPYGDPTQVWEWDGKLLVVDEGSLYYDGEKICNVTDGQKQFAVVNTKMIIWPDKLMIDLTDNSYVRMDAGIVTGEGVTFSENKITAPSIVKSATGQRTTTCGGYVDTWTPLIWTFGKDTAAVEACWVNGAWDMQALEQIAVRSAYWRYGTSYHVLEIGDIIIPTVSNGTYGTQVSTSFDDIPYPGNDSGKYGVLTGESGYYDRDYQSWGNIYVASSNAQYSSETSRVGFFYDVYTVGIGTSGMSDTFSAGDWITVTGTGSSAIDGIRKKITAVNDATGDITVSPAYENVPNGTFSGVSIKKDIPDMDYICEHENRLWGVSNNDKTICCSALGDPADWYSFDGTDADPYSVAVGSEGDFTGIISYGGGVCCFKENRLHKMLGSYPSEFYMNEYRIDGIQEGCNRSTIIVNEVLYYKGRNGVYAYSGGTPVMISAKLGIDEYSDAITGTDGRHLYLCMADSARDYHVFVYDLINGLWMKESDEYILSFTSIGSTMYALKLNNIEDNQIFAYDRNSIETFPWLAEFVPFTEDTFRKKSYSMLRVRVDMSAGSVMYIDTKTDNGAWKTALRKQAGNDLTFAVPLKINRCDRFCIRFRGTGRVTIRAMSREFHAGSARR